MWKLGLDISRYNPLYNPLARKEALMKTCDIDVVLDVGAGFGQFARLLRSQGYKRRIISFEPLSSEFKTLKENARKDRDWRVFNCALGDVCCQEEINVSLNKKSSSLFEMLPSYVLSAPDSIYVGKKKLKSRHSIRFFVIYARREIIFF